jgi:hypothetical protein
MTKKARLAGFVIGHWEFFRHSSFWIRHFSTVYLAFPTPTFIT